MVSSRVSSVAGRKVLMAFVSAVFCGLVASAGADTPTAPKYVITARWPLAGEGKWDYVTVDPARHRLYVSRETRVQILATESGAAVGEIPNTLGVHGIAVAPDLGVGFTSNGKANSVTVFDLATLTVQSELKLSKAGPDAIIYVPELRQVLIFSGHSKSATVIDAATRRELRVIDLPGSAEFAASNGKQVFVNLEDKNSVAVVDLATDSVSTVWPLGPCVGPTGLALDPSEHHLFSVCANHWMIILDTTTGRLVAKVPIGSHADAAAYDPALKLAFSSNGDSADVTVVSERTADDFVVAGSIATQPHSKTMALDPVSHRIFVPALIDGKAQVLVLTPTS